MRTRLKHWLGNALLALRALVSTLAVVEFLLFGVFLKPDDVVANVSINGVVRYEPGRVAVFRHPDGRTSRITINKDGWNSTIERYTSTRTPGRLRIAVIGDSYVNASQVNVEDAFPEVMSRRFGEKGMAAEVFRFGMDGAPLSQYLNVLRREVLAYKPDVVLVQLIHNDFDESYRFLKTRYASSFLKIDVDESGRAHEIEPVEFRTTIADVLRSSATFRYLYYETNLYLTLKGLVQRYFWGGQEVYDPAHIVSGIDVRTLDDMPRMSRVARYIISEMGKLAETKGFKLAFSMDAVRETIYGRKDEQTQKAGTLNHIAADAASHAQLPFLDLTNMFAGDYATHKQRFEYGYDWHWDERANQLVGETLADWIMEDPRLLGRKGPAAENEKAAGAGEKRG